jgi:o-succinylbenzoate synthase
LLVALLRDGGPAMIATVRQFELPLVSPLGTARGTIDAREGFLFDVFDDPMALGEATPLYPFTEARNVCLDVLQRAADAYTETGWVDAFREVSVTVEGELQYPAARHAVSLAYLDWRARVAYEPLYRHLGGEDGQGTVPVNATVGDHPAEETATAASEAVDEGYAALKVKVGNRSVDDDVERVEAVCSAVGPDVAVRLDANGAWSFEEARTFLEQTRELDLDYVEQPLDPGDLEGHERLRDRGTDIALDESVAMHPLAELLSADAADVYVLKPMATGGVDLARTIAMGLRERGYRATFATTIDSVVSRFGAIHAAASLPEVPPSELATGTFFEEDLAVAPAEVSGGAIALPEDPGLGIQEIDV